MLGGHKAMECTRRQKAQDCYRTKLMGSMNRIARLGTSAKLDNMLNSLRVASTRKKKLKNILQYPQKLELSGSKSARRLKRVIEKL